MAQMTLRQMRRVKEITQAQMAQAMGVSVCTYQAWEKCPAKIQTGKLMRVLQILGYSIFDLKLWGDGGKVAFVDHETGE